MYTPHTITEGLKVYLYDPVSTSRSYTWNDLKLVQVDLQNLELLGLHYIPFSVVIVQIVVTVHFNIHRSQINVIV